MRWLIFFALAGVSATASRVSQAQVRFTGSPRACAGAVDDATHTVSLLVQTPGKAPLSFQLEGETGGATIVASSPRVRIRSGSRVASPFLVASQQGQEVGRVRLDFAPAIPYRRFSYPFGVSDYMYQTGGFLVNHEGTRGKIYLKFRRSMKVGDVNGNWSPVAGHQLRIRVARVEQRFVGGQTFCLPAETARFGRVFNPEGPTAPDCLVTTRQDGTAEFAIEYFKPSFAAPPYERDRRVRFDFAVEDLTVSASANDAAPDSLPIQSVLLPSEVGEKPRWFDWPHDLSLRLMWESTAPRTKGSAQWKWCDVSDGTRQQEHGFSIETSVTSDFDDGVRGVRLSPDGSRALILRGRSGQYMDTCHDTLLAELSSGRVFGWHDYLFGTSETWNFNSDRVAFVDGSLDTIFGEEVAPPLVLCARDAQFPAPNVTPAPLSVGALDAKDTLPNAEVGFRTDDRLDRGSLAWMPDGQLLAGTQWVHGATQHHEDEEPTAPPLLLRFAASGGQAQHWQNYAWAPVAAPNGKYVAFKGYEQAPAGHWRDTSTALCICDADGRHRRTLTRLEDNGEAKLVFAPNSHSLFVREGNSICQYDLLSGARREVTRLDQSVELLGVSKNGLYLLVRHWQFKSENGPYHFGANHITGNSLFAIRLSDGQLIPLAVFNSDITLSAS